MSEVIRQESGEIERMSSSLITEFNRLIESGTYEDFMLQSRITPVHGIPGRLLQNFSERLKKRVIETRPIACVVPTGTDLALNFSAEADLEKLQKMADLLLFMQASQSRMINYEPIFEALKALVWRARESFSGTNNIDPIFDLSTTIGVLAEMELDEGIMPTIYNQYMQRPKVRPYLEKLIAAGARFSLDEPMSFGAWLHQDDDAFLYSRAKIKQAIDNLKQSVAAKLKEGVVKDLVAAKRDKNTTITLARASEKLRAEALKAIFTPPPLPEVIEPAGIIQVGSVKSKQSGNK